MKDFEWLPGEVHEVEDDFPDNAWEVFRSLKPREIHLSGLTLVPYAQWRWATPGDKWVRVVDWEMFQWTVADRRWLWPIAPALASDPEMEARVRGWCERHGARVEAESGWAHVYLADGYWVDSYQHRHKVIGSSWPELYKVLTQNVGRRVGA